MLGKEHGEMKSDAKFYLEEYRYCRAVYEQLPREHRKARDFYNRLGASMLAAYVEAVTKETTRV